MGLKSHIEWTGSTWNPVTGCSKISPGCSNCYAERLALRLKAMGQANYRNGFNVTLHDRMLPLPTKWITPQTIFVNSMSDLFHKDVPLDFILKIFNIMNIASHHQFQILTKRSDRMLQLNDTLRWFPNIWMGVSVENNDFVNRINHLQQINAATKFISFEPLIGPIDSLNLENIDWVIVGGESGPKARKINPEWVRDIRDQCVDFNIPFFFKQWGGVIKSKAGCTLDGKIWKQMPKAPLKGHSKSYSIR